MSYTETACAPCVQQAAAYKLMLDFVKSDDVPVIKGTLTDFFLEYMQNEVIDLADRQRAVFHYKVLADMLDGIHNLGVSYHKQQKNQEG